MAVPFFFVLDHDVSKDQDQQHGLRLWRNYLAGIEQEYQALDPQEQFWITGRLDKIATLQQQLNKLFVDAGGILACRQCSGACCDCGKNHFTLANMLAFISAGERPPEPDFSLPCPFLGAHGCRLEVNLRPFNCITFICEQVLEPLGKEGEECFLTLEKELRSHYLAFDRRYAGSSLCGLFIRAERLAGRPFLAHINQENDKEGALQ